jgi:uncharacterized membrane protein YoaK (UPF0700 family)
MRQPTERTSEELKVEAHTSHLLLLSWTAGMLDGLSYIRAHVFTANMTGNLVLLGIHLVQHDIADAIRSAVALAAFAAGCVFAGFLISNKEEPGQSIMPSGFAAEFILLLIFAALFLLEHRLNELTIEAALVITAAVALAIQSVTVRRLKVSGVATTFITGTITTSMVGLVRVLTKQQPRQDDRDAEEKHVALLLGMLAVYFTGVMFSTYLGPRLPWLVALTPAAILAFVFWRSRSTGVVPSSGNNSPSARSN